MKKKLTIWIILALFIGVQYQANAQCAGPTTLTATTGTFDDGSGGGNYSNN